MAARMLRQPFSLLQVELFFETLANFGQSKTITYEEIFDDRSDFLWFIHFFRPCKRGHITRGSCLFCK